MFWVKIDHVINYQPSIEEWKTHDSTECRPNRPVQLYSVIEYYRRMWLILTLCTMHINKRFAILIYCMKAVVSCYVNLSKRVVYGWIGMLMIFVHINEQLATNETVSGKRSILASSSLVLLSFCVINMSVGHATVVGHIPTGIFIRKFHETAFQIHFSDDMMFAQFDAIR